MSEISREQRVADAFVSVADTLTADYDVIELLHTLIEVCVDLLSVDAGGIVLADDLGELQVVATTSDKAQFVEVMQMNAGNGPCIDSYKTGKPVAVDDIAAEGAPWPEFQVAAAQQGFRAVFATPMRLRGHTLGAMNLFSTRVGAPTHADVVLAQALADVATIGILQERTARDSQILNEQLQRALESRVLIEQAKGVLAAVASLEMDEAFVAMRNYARSHSLSLRAVAEGVASRSLDEFFAEVVAKPSALGA